MRKLTWPIALVIAVCIIVFSPLAMGLEFVLFVDAIGLDMFAMLIETQLILTFGFVAAMAKQRILYAHHWMMGRDINYFIPTREIIRAYPPMIIHAVPGLVALPILILVISGRAMLDV